MPASDGGFVYDDGGRSEAGYRGTTRDCTCRAIAIATGKPYREVYTTLTKAAMDERRGRKGSARTGVSTLVIHRYLKTLGFMWTPTMRIGSGCSVHLREDELPPGRLIVRLSKHVCAVVDGVVHDNHDPRRGGTRCVYGYWRHHAE